jgi:hypothetical protein
VGKAHSLDPGAVLFKSLHFIFINVGQMCKSFWTAQDSITKHAELFLQGMYRPTGNLGKLVFSPWLNGYYGVSRFVVSYSKKSHSAVTDTIRFNHLPACELSAARKSSEEDNYPYVMVNSHTVICHSTPSSKRVCKHTPSRWFHRVKKFQLQIIFLGHRSICFVIIRMRWSLNVNIDYVMCVYWISLAYVKHGTKLL